MSASIRPGDSPLISQVNGGRLSILGSTVSSTADQLIAASTSLRLIHQISRFYAIHLGSKMHKDSHVIQCPPSIPLLPLATNCPTSTVRLGQSVMAIAPIQSSATTFRAQSIRTVRKNDLHDKSQNMARRIADLESSNERREYELLMLRRQIERLRILHMYSPDGAPGVFDDSPPSYHDGGSSIGSPTRQLS